VGDDAYEKVCQYLQLSMRIGNSGRRNEERAMLEALVKVDELQPSAYNNLFVCCSELAALAERFRPDEYDELESKAIIYLIKGIHMLVSDEPLQDGVESNQKRSFDGPHPMQLVIDAYIRTINTRGLTFLEGCMRGQRVSMPGESHSKLETIEMCLMAIVVLLTQNETTSFKEQSILLKELSRQHQLMMMVMAQKERRGRILQRNMLMISNGIISQCYRSDESLKSVYLFVFYMRKI